MFETNFYQNLINIYFDNINPPAHHQELAKVGGPISQYLADQSNNLIHITGNNSNHILDIDITSAFPTICHNLFNQNNNFIKQLNNIQEKKAKNIHIATTLKGEPLKQINQICKLIIMGIILDTDNQDELENILILELKKDGCLISCPTETLDRLTYLSSNSNKFTQFILSHNFQFHFEQYAKYIRSNRTSFLLNKSLDNITVKGYYKYIPTELKNNMFNFVTNKNQNINHINNIYNKKFFKILQKHNLKDYLEKYFLCNKNKVIDVTGKYVPLQLNTKVDPKIYQKIFIHPLIISNQTNTT